MRDEIEVAKAHDMLSAVMLHEVPSVPEGGRNEAAIKICLSVLCWVLEHDKTDEHNTAFGDLIGGIEATLKRRGFVMQRRNN